MSWIKNTVLNSVLVLVSFTIGLMLFEIFLQIDNKSKPVERINIEIYGNSYGFLKSECTTKNDSSISSSQEIQILFQ